MKKSFFIISALLLISLYAYNHIGKTFDNVDPKLQSTPIILPGANQLNLYLPLLEGKSVAIVANQTSVINGVHLLDTLISEGVKVKKIFTLEHGFRGKEDAGASIHDDIDAKTKIPILSLHGKRKKPSIESLKDVDVILFDIQDVGVRFYTYISSLHYIMEAAAENGVNVIVLDRPNPNAHYVDGPILQSKFKSFVGKHPVPVVYGMTIGEYAKMINGERWLKDSVVCPLGVIPIKNYSHQSFYSLPIPPSPNLPNDTAIALYPSLCFFEGTPISIGRGTNKPFQIMGYPNNPKGNYQFIPQPNEGASNPKLNGKNCNGFDYSKEALKYFNRSTNQLNIHWLIQAYQYYPEKEKFFLKNGFFNLLAGNNSLKQAIISEKTETEIRAGWKDDLDAFKTTREKYLIY